MQLLIRSNDNDITGSWSPCLLHNLGADGYIQQRDRLFMWIKILCFEYILWGTPTIESTFDVANMVITATVLVSSQIPNRVGLYWQIKIGFTSTKIRSSISYCIRLKQRDLFTQPCPIFNRCLANPPLMLGHRGLIASYRNLWIWLSTHTLC